MKRLALLFTALAALACTPILFAFDYPDGFREAVEADWARQEVTADRMIDKASALSDLVGRSEALLERLEEDEAIDQTCAEALRQEIDRVKSCDIKALSPKEIAEKYLALRWRTREAALSNPLVKDIPIVFLKEDRYVWQLIHEYLSYYYSHTKMQGGELMLLENPGFSFEARSLTEGKLPRGVFETPSISFDGKTLYFAFADFTNVVSEKEPPITFRWLQIRGYDHDIEDYLARTDGKFHLYKMDLASGKIEQLTDGPDDDFDPAELPDGDLVFMSTRRGGFARCTGDCEPVEDATLHRLDKDGTIKTLSWHETNEWNPSVLQDGRIVYTRWDYVDREAARYMNLWVTNPDGTGAQALFGNYTEQIVAMLGAKAIPNSNKIMFIASGHHIAVGGALGILDLTKMSYDQESGEDNLDAIEVLSPEIPFPETPSKDGRGTSTNGEFNCLSRNYYYSPFPLSEDYYLTAYSHDPNGGYLATAGYSITMDRTYHYTGRVGQPFSSGKMGLYYRDRFGNLELLYQDPHVACRHPMQTAAREKPPVIASKLPATDKPEGTFVLSNVYESVFPMPKDRKIVALRVFELFSHEPEYYSDTPKLGYPHAANARACLGEVPVEEDGSAHFKAPACKPLYFQAIDEEGKAVQTMLSEVYLQPGENRGCVGCHEQYQTAAQNVPVQGKALTRPASEMVPGPDGSSPICYPRLIQPILDRRCVSCHDDSDKAAKPDLRGVDHGEYFSLSYENMRPYVRFFDWGGNGGLSRIVSYPGKCAADESPLTEILADANHREKTGLTDEELRTIYLWLDSNCQFYGTGIPEDMQRQKLGEAVPCPRN
ncbi:MAG: hypothetical protein IJH68_07975 [Thermoguttaceae bacterium]|nr:hypothetical protein [Thermoguttaceae bacterium]